MYTLITAANSSQAYKLKSMLNAEHVLLGDYLELPDLLVKSGNVIRLPNPETTTYTHEMLKLCLDKGINTVCPLREDEKLLLLDAEQLFHEYGISIKVINDEV